MEAICLNNPDAKLVSLHDPRMSTLICRDPMSDAGTFFMWEVFDDLFYVIQVKSLSLERNLWRMVLQGIPWNLKK